jgi:hypothetical protein
LRQFKEFFVNRAHLQFTLREMRDMFLRKNTIAVLAGVAVMMGVSGPFATISAFDLLPRLAYWAVVVPMTFGAGMFGSLIVRPWLGKWPILGQALGSAIMVSGALGLVHGVVGLRFDLQETALGFAAVYIICLAIEGVFAAVNSTPPQSPALLARLALDKRGDLIQLQVEDHYVAVTTTKGRSLILMRLSDAIAQTAPVRGLQIHRSYWVALDQIQTVRRRGDAAVVVMRTGEELPVARPRLRSVQEAGLLPQGGK